MSLPFAVFVVLKFLSWKLKAFLPCYLRLISGKEQIVVTTSNLTEDIR